MYTKKPSKQKKTVFYKNQINKIKIMYFQTFFHAKIIPKKESFSQFFIS